LIPDLPAPGRKTKEQTTTRIDQGMQKKQQ